MVRPRYKMSLEGKGDMVLAAFFKDWSSKKQASHTYNPGLPKNARNDRTVTAYFDRLKKEGFLESKRAPYKTLRKMRNGKYKTYTNYEVRHRANLNFFYYFAKEQGIKFEEVEKFYLEVLFDWPGARNQISSKNGIRNEFAKIILKIVGFSISGWEEEVKDYETTNKQKIVARKNYYSGIKLETSSYNLRKMKSFLKKIKKINPKLWVNELISSMPYTLLIKLLKMYLPFEIGRELIKKDMEDINLIQNKELSPQEGPYFAKKIRKPRTKVQIIRQHIIDIYESYKPRPEVSS